MPGIVWWTPARLAWLAAKAAEGLAAARIAALARAKWRRDPPVNARSVRDAAQAHGIRMLNRGGRPYKKEG